MEVPLMVRDLFRLVPPGTSIQALVIFVPGARMSTTMVISLFCSTASIYGGGGLTIAIIGVSGLSIAIIDSSNGNSSWL